MSLTWEVWRRSTDDPDEPEHVRTVADLHVLIDRVTGRRVTVHDDELDGDEEFISFAESAEHVPLTYSCTEPQLELVLDEWHRLMGAFGGEGGGKTELLALWMVRSLLLVGGRGVLLWWVAPSLAQTRIAVDKLVAGEDGRPPLLPEALVLRWPRSEYARQQEIVFVDRTRLQLLYAATGIRAGGQFKGRRPRKIGVDEGCEIWSPRIWKILFGRVTRARHQADDVDLGQIFVSSTPEEGHLLEREVVVPVDAKSTEDTTYRSMTQFDNPWIPMADIEAAIKRKGGRDDPQCQRDVFGRWVASVGRAYYRFELRRHVARFDSLEQLGLVDVTDVVVRERWGTLAPSVGTTYVGAQDFNVGYCMSTIYKLAVSADTGYRTDDDLIIVAVAEHRTRWAGYENHGYQLRERWGRIAIACDATGAQIDTRVEPGNRQATTHARRLARAGHDVRPCWVSPGGAPTNPSVDESLEQVNELLAESVGPHPRVYVHADCSELIDSLTLVRRTDDQKQIDKVAGKKSDHQSGAGDSFRYFAAFHFPARLKALNEQSSRQLARAAQHAGA